MDDDILNDADKALKILKGDYSFTFSSEEGKRVMED